MKTYVRSDPNSTTKMGVATGVALDVSTDVAMGATTD